MAASFFSFLLVILFLAVLLKDPALITLLYLLVGVYLVGRFWSRNTLFSLSFQRRFSKRAFLGEEIAVRLELRNRSWLPAPWVKIHESLPVDLAVPSFYRYVIDLPPKGKAALSYTLKGNKRGYYPVGPLFLQSGDLFGLEGEQERVGPIEHITVYPKILPIPDINLPSFSPLGTLRFQQPIFEDPSRVAGKREYQPGDSIRRIDWKATAASGRLQVRQYEPSISLEVALFLNLCAEEYEARTRLDGAELAVVTAASLANFVFTRRQAVGLETNGVDPLAPQGRFHSLPPGKGSAHLMLILEKLARVQPSEGVTLSDMICERGPTLSWGTTLLVITGTPNEELFDNLFRARRWGLHSEVFLTAPVIRFEEYESRAGSLGIRLHEIRAERDLETIPA